MTAIANPPSLPAINRPFWAPNGNGHQPVGGNQQSDDFSRVFLPPRGKQLERSNSVSSVSSNSSASSVSTVLSTPQSNGSSVSSNGDANVNNVNTWTAATPRKRPQQQKAAPWIGPQKNDPPTGRQPLGPMKPGAANGMHPAPPLPPPQGVGTRSSTPVMDNGQNANVVLCLLSLNGTFERKTISVPYYPNTLRIGRQTNQRTVPTPTNGYFDSKVLSRQHAEIWADRETAKVYIRDVKSSNGTFVNGNRLSQENRESDPHELSVGDHLELGIDIVNDDQKTVVHHKVAAKVDHVGFLSNSMTDMFANDVDPNGNANMMQGQVQGRGRTGSNASMTSNGRMGPVSGMGGAQPNGMGPSRPIWMAQITTDQIVKKLHQEMRSSRLQAQDLLRTGQFVGALLSKDDLKDFEKPEAPEAPKPHVNGNGLLGSFQANGKTRFSDPPAPPPQQPLPEKPDFTRNGDIPSLKRGITERPKGQRENQSQIAQLTEDLRNAKKELDSQNARMRNLEDMLNQERAAREFAEKIANQLEAAAKATESEATGAELDNAFDPPAESTRGAPSNDKPDVAASLQARLDAMMAEMLGLKQQLDEYKDRAQKAEDERDSSRKSLSEMVIQIREEQAARKAAEEEAQLLRKRRPSQSGGANGSAKTAAGSPEEEADSVEAPGATSAKSPPSLSRSSTVTPAKASGQLAQRHAVAHTLPYASMISVVVLGMGLMAYLNGWQPEPRVQR